MASSPEIEWEVLDTSTIRSGLGLSSDEVNPSTEFISRPAPKKRGRPPKIISRAAEEVADNIIPFTPAPITQRDEKAVQKRLHGILTGTTGILSNAKPYLQMTEEEAEAISIPLAAYLVRNADTIPVARQVLENYDLAAIGIGTGAYLVRVYHDRAAEISEQSPSFKPTFIDRLRPSNGPIEEEPEIRNDGEIDPTNGESFRVNAKLRRNERNGNP